MQQHISKSCASRWALIDYCKAVESLPVHTNPQGVLNSQGYWHTRGVVTLAHAMGALLAVPKLDWTRSTWIMLCMALTWKADGTSAGLASTLHQATLWCCLQPTCLHKTHTEGGTQCQVPTFVFAHLCFLRLTKVEPKGKGNRAAPSEFVAWVHANGQPKLGPLSIPSSRENWQASGSIMVTCIRNW